MKQALEDILVLDLSRALAGPYCSLLLADLGADVIKIERPERGDDSRHWGPPFQGGESSYFLSVNRNKRSLTLDIQKERGKEIFRKLVKKADVVIENLRPGKMKSLGLSYEDLHQENERLIWCSITGFGSTGPESLRPGYDIIAQGMGGMMSITGEKDKAIRPGVALADISTGMFAVEGILAALYEREKSGKGQSIDTSLFEGQIAQLTYQAGRYFASEEAPSRYGNKHPLIAPYEDIKTKDGSINIACGNDSLWKKFCRALDLRALLEDSRFSSNSKRIENRDELLAKIENRSKNISTKELGKLLDEAGVPNGPIWNLEEVFSCEQAKSRDMILEVDHPKAGRIQTTGMPIKMSRTPCKVRRHPPLLGEHNQEVLTELLDLREEEMSQLKEDKVL